MSPMYFVFDRSVSGLIPGSAATDLIVASGRDACRATASA